MLGFQYVYIDKIYKIMQASYLERSDIYMIYDIRCLEFFAAVIGSIIHLINNAYCFFIYTYILFQEASLFIPSV